MERAVVRQWTGRSAFSRWRLRSGKQLAQLLKRVGLQLFQVRIHAAQARLLIQLLADGLLYGLAQFRDR